MEWEFPGGKTNPRDTLKLGRKIIQEYKLGKQEKPEIKPPIVNRAETKQVKIKSPLIQEKEKPKPIAPITTSSETIAAFKLVWKKKI